MKKELYQYTNEKKDVNLSFDFPVDGDEKRRKKNDFLQLLYKAVEDLEKELNQEAKG